MSRSVTYILLYCMYGISFRLIFLSLLCHFSLDKRGFEKISKPTKSEICQFEVKGQSHKSYSYNMLEQHPHLLSAYHLEHKYNLKNGKLFLTPHELDYIVYGKLKKAI